MTFNARRRSVFLQNHGGRAIIWDCSVYMLLKIVLPSTMSCGTKNRDVKGGVMEGAPMSPPA